MSKPDPALLRALVVDDDSDIRRQIGEVLTSRGWSVRLCGNGREAIDAVDDFNPLVAVLDLKMPIMTGTEVLREVRKRRPWAQVIIITGHGTEDDAVQSLNDHAFAFMRKPVSPFAVAAKCEEAIESIPTPIFAFYQWFHALPDPNRVVFQTASGKQVSAKDLLAEIESQSEEGRAFVEHVMRVAVELISKRL